VLGVADDFTAFLQPGLAVDVGRIHNQRVALPSGHGIALPRADGVRKVRAAIQWDDSPNQALMQEDDGLNDVKRRRDAANEAVRPIQRNPPSLPPIALTPSLSASFLKFAHALSLRRPAAWAVADQALGDTARAKATGRRSDQCRGMFPDSGRIVLKVEKLRRTRRCQT